MPFEVIPIIDIPGYGDKSAQVSCRTSTCVQVLITAVDKRSSSQLLTRHSLASWRSLCKHAAAAAQVVCEQLKVQSQNDTAKLAEAKQLVYLKVWRSAAGQENHRHTCMAACACCQHASQLSGPLRSPLPILIS